jgi:hypothetical protein
MNLVFNQSRNWLWLALWGCLAAARAHAETRVALVSTCGGEAGQNVLALAEAKLSAEKDIALVERHEVERVLDEQKLTRCGLSDSAQALAVGKLLGVQVFITLETFPGSQETLGLVIFDARSGAKLWDAALPAGGVDKTAEGIVTAVHEACEKRLRPTTKLRTICLLSVRNAELPRAMDSFCESVGQLLERGLLGSASLTVLERERLEQINRERLLPTNEVTNDLLPSLTLLELELSRGSESNGVKATVFLSDASGASLGKVKAIGSIERAADLVEALLQGLTKSLKAAPSARGVDRPREAQRFQQEANFFIEHMQFAKGLQAVEAAHALNPTNEVLRVLLADALSKAASDILAPGQPWDNSWISKVASNDLKRALGLAHRSADLCLDIRAQMASLGTPSPNSWLEAPTFSGFLQRARNVRVGYDEESRRRLAELQAKYRRMLVEFWERPTFAVGPDPSLSICCPGNLYWFLGSLEFGAATSEGWTIDAVRTLNRWLALLDKRGLCNVKTETVNWMLTPIVYRIKEPSRMYEGCHGQYCWSLDEADMAQLQVFFDALGRSQEPLFQLYTMMSELAAVVRKEHGEGEEVDNQFAQIKNLGKQIISNPPCEKSDSYRVAVYQALLDTIDLLPDPVMRRKEYQELFEFMLERREYVHWVAMATIDPQSQIYAAYQYMGSVFPRYKEEIITKGDPKICAQNLARLLALLELPDCRRISEPSDSWRGPLDQQLAQIRDALVAQEPTLKSQTPVPWSAARLLYDGSRPLLQPQVFADSVWGLELFRTGIGTEQLRLVRVPLDGKAPQRYDQIPPDGPPEKFYSVIVKEGIAIFPADAGAMSRVTETNGLPSSLVSAAACCDSKLFAGIGTNSGHEGTAGYLISCDLVTGHITTLASSLRKEKLSSLDDVSPPFFVRQMIPDPKRHRVLFTTDIGIYKGGTPYTGLWSVDTRDDQLTRLIPLAESCEWMSPIHGNQLLLGCRRWERESRCAVFSFNLDTNKGKLLYASQWSAADQPFIEGGEVCKAPMGTYSPYVVLDKWLWAADPFCRFPADCGPREFFPSFVKGDSFSHFNHPQYFEALEDRGQLLVGVGSQLWLLDLKTNAATTAEAPAKPGQ